MNANTPWTHAERNDTAYIALAEELNELMAPLRESGPDAGTGGVSAMTAERVTASGSSACEAMNSMRMKLRRYHLPLIPQLLSRASIAFFGQRPYETHGPTIEPGMFIGARATVRGPISVGRDAQLGDAVIDVDVPSGATVAGAPARMIGTGAPSRLDRALQDKQAQ